MLTNNDILKRLRYAFNLNDETLLDLFALGDLTVTPQQIEFWLNKDDKPEYQPINDFQLASFLNGFIVHKRGPKPGVKPAAEKQLNNNIVLRKLKIALELKDEDILKTLQKVDFKFSKSELSAFFRKPGHKHYRECKDQFLRNFLLGLSK